MPSSSTVNVCRKGSSLRTTTRSPPDISYAERSYSKSLRVTVASASVTSTVERRDGEDGRDRASPRRGDHDVDGPPLAALSARGAMAAPSGDDGGHRADDGDQGAGHDEQPRHEVEEARGGGEAEGGPEHGRDARERDHDAHDLRPGAEPPDEERGDPRQDRQRQEERQVVGDVEPPDERRRHHQEGPESHHHEPEHGEPRPPCVGPVIGGGRRSVRLHLAPPSPFDQ